jgi:hypothetical protein
MSSKPFGHFECDGAKYFYIRLGSRLYLVERGERGVHFMAVGEAESGGGFLAPDECPDPPTPPGKPGWTGLNKP